VVVITRVLVAVVDGVSISIRRVVSVLVDPEDSALVNFHVVSHAALDKLT